MIQDWLSRFFTSWKNYDIESVLSLFTDDVGYWETTQKKIEGKNLLKKEWEYINTQRNIDISYNILSESDDGYTVFWKLRYTDAQDKKRIWSGLYFLKLNNAGICTYFLQCGEEKLHNP